MGGVKLVLKHKPDSEELVFCMPAEPYKTRLLEVLNRCHDKTNGYCTVEINRPYKPRTTGELSQNNLVWKLITIIANEVGEDVKEIEYQAKVKAISKGYPYHISKITGKPVPDSMTTIDTVQCSYLIDTLYEIISFLGIVLEPALSKEGVKLDGVKLDLERNNIQQVESNLGFEKTDNRREGVLELVEQAFSEASKKETEEEIHNADLFDGDIF